LSKREALSFSVFETAMGFVRKEGLQPSGTTYRVALLHMAPVRSVMSRFVFQA
jgi:hypothetical protein